MKNSNKNYPSENHRLVCEMLDQINLKDLLFDYVDKLGVANGIETFIRHFNSLKAPNGAIYTNASLRYAIARIKNKTY